MLVTSWDILLNSVQWQDALDSFDHSKAVGGLLLTWVGFHSVFNAMGPMLSQCKSVMNFSRACSVTPAEDLALCGGKEKPGLHVSYMGTS